MKIRILQMAMGLVLGLMVALLVTFRDALPGMGGAVTGPPEATLLLPDPFPPAPLALTDPDGDPVTLERFRGSVVAIFFGYTNCPDVCPITLARLGRFQEEEDRTPPLEVVFVSVDPDRDTPERLRDFTAGLPGRVLAITGPEEEVRAQSRDFGVLVREQPLSGAPEGEYLVDHTARTFILDPGGQVVATLPPMASPEEVRAVMAAVYRSLERP